jgi:cell division protein FtsQ
MDPRIAARRRHVREQGARHRLRWLLGVVVVLLLALAAWWLVQSPYLAIDEIVVRGQRRADTQAALDRAGIAEGMPVVTVRTERVERELRADPWVRDAAVAIGFPHVVEIDILEHDPFAAVSTGSGWRVVAADGKVLDEVAEAPAGLATVEGAPVVEAGALYTDAATLGALEFIGAVTPALRPRTRVAEVSGELWAYLDGYSARLGTAREMAEKGAVVSALVGDGVDEGWTIDVVAPGRPALVPPPAPAPEPGEPEIEGDASGEAQPEGQGE